LPLLAEAFAIDGLYAKRGTKGKAVVLCPNASMHTDCTDGTTSTVILPFGVMGVFKCSHEHCKALDNEEVIRRLSPEAQGWLDEQMKKPGVEKVKRQLDAQAHPFDPDVTLAEVEQELVNAHQMPEITLASAVQHAWFEAVVAQRQYVDTLEEEHLDRASRHAEQARKHLDELKALAKAVNCMFVKEDTERIDGRMVEYDRLVAHTSTDVKEIL